MFEGMSGEEDGEREGVEMKCTFGTISNLSMRDLSGSTTKAEVSFRVGISISG